MGILRQSSQHMRRIIFSIIAWVVITGAVWLVTGCSFEETPANVPPWYPATNENGDPIFAVFFNRLPCPDCKMPPGPPSKIKFQLVLYKDRETQAPTTYKMARVYAAQGPTDRIINEGTWTITQGTKSDPQAIVYQLDANAPDEFRSYLVISDDILFILDQEQQPRVGNGFYSYTLNREQ